MAVESRVMSADSVRHDNFEVFEVHELIYALPDSHQIRPAEVA
jgi:hypothetical protein